MKPLNALGNAAKMAIDSGIVRRADLTLELDNDKIAEVLQGAALHALSMLPQVEISQVNNGPMISAANDRAAAHEANSARTAAKLLKSSGQEVKFDVPEGENVDIRSISPHTATIKIHHDRIAEGIAKGLTTALKGASTQMTEEDGHLSYRLVPGDDGKKVRLQIDTTLLEKILSMKKKDTRVEGILDSSDIPENREQMMAMFQSVMGMDPETRETIVDGQAVLKLLQAYMNDSHEKSAEDAEKKQPTLNELYERFKGFMDKVPGSKVNRKDDLITLELDMKQLSDASKAATDYHLTKIKGITLPPENAEDRFVTTAKIDFKQLTEQALAVAADQLKDKKGVRIHTNGTTVVTFNSDLMKGDMKLADVGGQLSALVTQLGQGVAQQAIGAKPSSLVQSVIKHFFKGPQNPGQQL